MIESGVAMRIVDHPDHTLPALIEGATPMDCTTVGLAPTTPGFEGELWTVQTPAGRVVVHEEQLVRRGEPAEVPGPKSPAPSHIRVGFAVLERIAYRVLTLDAATLARIGLSRPLLDAAVHGAKFDDEGGRDAMRRASEALTQRDEIRIEAEIRARAIRQGTERRMAGRFRPEDAEAIDEVVIQVILEAIADGRLSVEDLRAEPES